MPRSGPVTPWTAAELNLVTLGWPTMAVAELLKLLPGRTADAVQFKARQLGVRKRLSPVPPLWAATEEQALQALWSSAPMSEIQAKLPNRTPASIRTRARRLHLRGRRVRRQPPKQPEEPSAPCSPRVQYWTDDLDRLLTWMYPRAPKEILALAFPRATKRALYNRALHLGMYRLGRREAPHHCWTEAENQQLASDWSRSSRAALLQKFPFASWRGLERKASKLKLRRRPWGSLPPSVSPNQGEIWRCFLRAKRRFWVSTHGRVAGEKGLVKLHSRGDGGRLSVQIYKGKRSGMTTLSVARLVLAVFTEARSRAFIPAFRDSDPCNNRLENLYWVAAEARRSSKPAHDAIPMGERLRARLNENAAWAAASNAVSKSLSADVRDDVISDLVVAHLSGELALEDIARRASEFARRHNREFGSYGTISLDQMVKGTDDLRLGDMISEDDYRERWEALEGLE